MILLLLIEAQPWVVGTGECHTVREAASEKADAAEQFSS
jgi:hypothetical protein